MIYEIRNLSAFSRSIGKQVAREGGFTVRELKTYISVKNIKNIVRKYANYKNEAFYIDEERTHLVCEEIFDWLTGVNLAKLASEDYLDCWWDSEKNTMIFKKKYSDEEF